MFYLLCFFVCFLSHYNLIHKVFLAFIAVLFFEQFLQIFSRSWKIRSCHKLRYKVYSSDNCKYCCHVLSIKVKQ